MDAITLDVAEIVLAMAQRDEDEPMDAASLLAFRENAKALAESVIAAVARGKDVQTAAGAIANILHYVTGEARDALEARELARTVVRVALDRHASELEDS